MRGLELAVDAGHANADVSQGWTISLSPRECFLMVSIWQVERRSLSVTWNF